MIPCCTDNVQSGLITDKTAGSLHIAERGHVLVAELQANGRVSDRRRADSAKLNRFPRAPSKDR
jgi:hypothetical protein